MSQTLDGRRTEQLAMGVVRRMLGIVDFPGSGRWAAASLINSAGTGLLLPLSVLFFTVHVGISPSSVGAGLTIGGLIAIAFVPLGGLAVDRFGAKPVLLGCWGWAAVAYAAYGAVHNWGELLAAVTMAEIGAAASATASKALLAELATGAQRAGVFASQRSLSNLGYGVGGLLATAALALGGAAWACVVYGDAVTFLIAIVLAWGVPVPSRPARAGNRMAGGLRLALADRRYVTLSALDFLTTFQDGALAVALPLWLVLHTHAPRALAGILFTINTLVVVLFQVRATGGVTSIADVPRTYRRGAALMAVCATTYLAAHYVGEAAAVILLILGLLLHTAAEMFVSAGEWTASVAFADHAHRGTYLAVYRLGYSIQDALAPLVITALLALGTVWVWPVLALAVCGGALASAAIVGAEDRCVSQRLEASAEQAGRRGGVIAGTAVNDGVRMLGREAE
jgi:MFS family permease